MAEAKHNETRGYQLHHTMIRVKDPQKSLHFYRDLLGMKQVGKMDFPEAKFSLYFLAYTDQEVPPEGSDEAANFLWSFPGHCIELTHNYGTEDQADFSYHSGNTEPKGFGHIALLVPDVYEACNRLEAAGVTFKKRPDEGRMKGLAFALDPDGYWIEIIKRRWSP